MNNSSSRRKFLKRAAVSAPFSIMAAKTALGYEANSAVSLGVIGFGGRGKSVVKSFMKYTDTRITAIADIFEDQLNKGAAYVDDINKWKKYPLIKSSNLFKGLSAYKKLLDSKDVDSVLISTPVYFHPEHLEAAVDAGKHIYCEKPVAPDVYGVKRFMSAGERAKGKQTLAVGLQVRHATPFIELAKRIHDGDIGEIATVQAYYFAGQLQSVFRNDLPDDEALLRSQKMYYNFTGGILVEQGIHIVDVCNWFLGSHPEKAVGMGGRKSRKDFGDNWSHCHVLYEYPGNIHASFHSTQLDPSYDDVCVRLFGNKGIAEAHYSGGVFIKGDNEWDSGMSKGKPDNISKEDWEKGAFKSALDDSDPNKEKAFVESIKTGNYINEMDIGSESALTAILGRTAAESGKETFWEQIMKSDNRIDPGIDFTRFDDV